MKSGKDVRLRWPLGSRLLAQRQLVHLGGQIVVLIKYIGTRYDSGIHRASHATSGRGQSLLVRGMRGGQAASLTLRADLPSFQTSWKVSFCVQSALRWGLWLGAGPGKPPLTYLRAGAYAASITLNGGRWDEAECNLGACQASGSIGTLKIL
jgi:hypothetical protein